MVGNPISGKVKDYTENAMEKKNLFHRIKHLVLGKPEAEANTEEANTADIAMNCADAVWVMNVDGSRVSGVKKHYTRIDEETWAETEALGGKTQIVRTEDVMEALRNA